MEAVPPMTLAAFRPFRRIRKEQSAWSVMTAAVSPDSATEAQVAAALARCAAGDRTALRVIYDAEAPRMVGVARRILRRQDLADEAGHGALLRGGRAGGAPPPRQRGGP